MLDRQEYLRLEEDDGPTGSSDHHMAYYAADFQSSFRGAPNLLEPSRRRKGNPWFSGYFFAFFFRFFFAFGTEITCRSNVAIAGLTLPTATKFCPRGLLMRIHTNQTKTTPIDGSNLDGRTKRTTHSQLGGDGSLYHPTISNLLTENPLADTYLERSTAPGKVWPSQFGPSYVVEVATFSKNSLAIFLVLELMLPSCFCANSSILSFC